MYPFNAEKFVKCVRSQMEVVTCSPAQVFSITRRTCLPVSQVLKYERVRLPSELQKTDSYRNVDEHFDVYTMVYCPMGLTGTYPHPFDGSKYITCGAGRLVCESCASGKAFSLSRKECDMKEELDANDRVPQIQMSYGEEFPVTDIESTYGSSEYKIRFHWIRLLLNIEYVFSFNFSRWSDLSYVSAWLKWRIPASIRLYQVH